jgi:hypothetical protein
MTADADDMETLQARLDGQSRLDQAAQQQGWADGRPRIPEGDDPHRQSAAGSP